MAKKEAVYMQLEGIIKKEILEELKYVVDRLCGFISALDYAYITDFRYRYQHSTAYIDIIIEYKPNISFYKLMTATKMVYEFLRSQNPEVVYHINILGRLPKELMKNGI